MSLLGNVTGKEISVIKDPFNKDCIGDIAINYTTSFGSRYWYARIQFKNGNTSGEQRTPNCETFEEVVAQIKIILNSINQ